MADDAELLERWSQGDDESGEQLYRRHFRIVYAFFRSKTPDDVDDLVQDTFMTAVRKSGQRRGGSVRAFLLGIARYELLEYLRTKARMQERIDPVTSSIHDLATGPSTELRRDDDGDRLRLALQSLPLDQQIALELRYWHEMTAEEIAQVQEVTPATVRTRLHRARASLRPLVDEGEVGALPVGLRGA